MTAFTWYDQAEDASDFGHQDKKRSFESRRRTLQRRAIRWEKFGDDFRKLGGR